MKRIKQLSIWIIALAMVMTAGAAMQAQRVNMNRFIKLTVKSGENIKLQFRVASAGTPVRVVSGSNSTDVTVDAVEDWSPDQNFMSDGTTMIVYGDIIGIDCGFNGDRLTALNLFRNTKLDALYCESNKITALNVSACTQLKELDCSGNSLTALNVSACTQLKGLDCSNNSLTALDVGRCPQLDWLFCTGNALTALNLSRNTKLDILYCGSNEITVLNVSRCAQLSSLDCHNNSLTALNVSASTQLKKLDCRNNSLTALNVSASTQLEELDCSQNSLTTLNVSAFTQLKSLDCRKNSLTDLDVSGCTQLSSLNCSNNSLTALDVSGCTQLSSLSCYNNYFSSYALDRLYCTLPDRSTLTMQGSISPAEEIGDQNRRIVLNSSGSIATGKNWRITTAYEGKDMETRGTETCSRLSFNVTPATLNFTAAGREKSIIVGRKRSMGSPMRRAGNHVQPLAEDVYFVQVGERVTKILIK